MLIPILSEEMQRSVFAAHNSLHGTRPLLPKHPHFTRSAEVHPIENTRHSKRSSCCGTEGRGFKPRRSPQIFQTLWIGFSSPVVARGLQNASSSFIALSLLSGMSLMKWRSVVLIPPRKGKRCGSTLP